MVGLQLLLRVWNAAVTPVTLLMLTRSLTRTEQGVYYSFGSVQALTVLFELGFAFVLAQFAAHESARIADPEKGERAAARLGSLLYLGIKWNGGAALGSLALLIPLGCYFFAGTPGLAQAGWLGPWLVFASASAALVALAPFHAILEGSGHLQQVSLIRLLQGFAATLMLWLGFSAGWGLYSLALSQLVGLIVNAAGLMLIRGKTLRGIWRGRSAGCQIDYRMEVWPMHWRVALSWLAGYVGLYLSTPLIFKALSPEEAGRYGMTFGLMLSISNVASIWMNAQAPALARWAALGEIGRMRSEFERAARRSCAVLLAALGLIAGALWAYRHLSVKIEFLDRLLGGPVLLILGGATVGMHVYGLLNSYFRAFRADPLFGLSIGTAGAALLLLLAARGTGSLLIIVSIPLVLNWAATVIALNRYRSRIPLRS